MRIANDFINHAPEAFNKTFLVGERYTKPRFVVDELGGASIVSNNRSDAQGHRLQNDLSSEFPNARQRHKIAGTQQFLYIGMRDPAVEMHAFPDAKSVDNSLKTWPLRPLSDN